MQLCPYCGVEDYNLEGTCPNCGAPFPKSEVIAPLPVVQYQVVLRPSVPQRTQPNNSTSLVATAVWTIVGFFVLLMGGCVVFLIERGERPLPDMRITNPNSAEVSASGKWTVAQGKSHITTGDALVAQIMAESIIESKETRDRPVLYCECSNRSLKVFINTGMTLSRESGRYSVKLIFDNGKPLKQYWLGSTDMKGLQAKNASEFLKLLQNS